LSNPELPVSGVKANGLRLLVHWYWWGKNR
jgi:hypothetical protein